MLLITNLVRAHLVAPIRRRLNELHRSQLATAAAYHAETADEIDVEVMTLRIEQLRHARMARELKQRLAELA